MISWILDIWGIICLGVFIIAFLVSRKEYTSDIKIKVITDELEANKFGIHYYDIAEVFNDEYSQYFLIMSNECDLKNIGLYELGYDEKSYKLYEKRKIQKFDTLKSNYGIIVKTTPPEVIPRLKISWESNYGLKGEYVFYYNGFNGVVDLENYKYKYTFIAKIRVLLGLK